MKLSDIFFAILYGGAFILIIYFIFGLIYKQTDQPMTAVYDETPVYQESAMWPWTGTQYNYWSYWAGWWSGGDNGGYGNGGYGNGGYGNGGYSNGGYSNGGYGNRGVSGRVNRDTREHN